MRVFPQIFLVFCFVFLQTVFCQECEPNCREDVCSKPQCPDEFVVKEECGCCLTCQGEYGVCTYPPNCTSVTCFMPRYCPKEFIYKDPCECCPRCRCIRKK